ncbi:unnamed protein product [Arctogadus glacialis]
MTSWPEYKEVVREVTRCCHGFVHMGRYCVLPLNRTREFTTKPGFCPTAAEKSHDGCQTCVWDIDCPANGGWRLNVTVTVKTDYDVMMALDKGLLNHTQLLHTMVSGALNSSDISVQYLSSCPVVPYRTATSLIIGCDATLSLDVTTAKLHRLLRDISEVTSVTVEDVDECAHTALRNCSPHAECNNTAASYHCSCRHGYTDVLPKNAGASCEVYQTPTNATPCINGQTGSTSQSPSATPGPTVDPPWWSTSAPTTLQTSATSNTSPPPPEKMSTCAPPKLTQLSSSHITGTSFCLSWSGLTQSNKTSYLVDLKEGSEIIIHLETNKTKVNMTDLDPGVLYSVTITPYACDAQGESHLLNVKTAAQNLKATAKVTNVNFTDEFLNSSSQAYFNFSKSIKEEIYKSLSSELKELVDSGKVRIEITSLSQGSVVVNFSIVYDASVTKLNVSSAVLGSLLNSTRYSVDENSNSVSDVDECASGQNDPCSQNATCNNTWGSYTCVCNDGFEDMDSDWPGRVCGGICPVHHCTCHYPFLSPVHHCTCHYLFLSPVHHCTCHYPFLSPVHHCTCHYLFLSPVHHCTCHYLFLSPVHHCTCHYLFLSPVHHCTCHYPFLSPVHHCTCHYLFLSPVHHCTSYCHFLSPAQHCTCHYLFVSPAHH